MTIGFFFDEKQEAERILKEGFNENRFNSYQAYLLAKYFRHVLGYGDQRTKTSLIIFAENHDEQFNYVASLETIKACVKNSKREFKSKTHSLTITENEIAKIRNIKNFDTQILFLVFLLYAKRNDGYVYRDKWADMKKIMKLNLTDNQIYEHLHSLYKLGYLRPSNKNVFMKMLDYDSKPVFKFETDRDVLNVKNTYIEYCGGVLGYCINCEKEIKINSNRKKYCEDCWKEKRKKDVKNNVKRYRNKV